MSLVGRNVESLNGRGFGADEEVDHELDWETGKRAARRPVAGCLGGSSAPADEDGAAAEDEWAELEAE